MTGLTILPLAGTLLAGGIGTLLFAAGLAKLRDHDGFLTTLAAYRLVPAALLESTAWALAGAETAVGVTLLAGLAPLTASLGAALLFAMFALAMAINLLRGRTDLSCGCLPGMASARLSWAAVARSALLAPASLLPALTGQPASLLLRYQALAAGACLLALALALSHLISAIPGPEEHSA
ncbi:MauE/DoxX family redox-associated membrane protein [Gluconacetobacter tumulicola]|uniref:Methylamine utilization protein MauE n=1 Tax=Gluconacetobacter tumulicola TaxID=1017177 RepID=A0A7W4JFW7_9PROT|nr:MauE/DoxX family redox-associated membrane protein [Gluconacetobacter tumulicola]MBB2180541.1 methylamine utilization protein MauE [Gluconacetobacter tumulicola]